MISWVQSGLDLTIDLTVQDEDTKKKLKAGTAAAAVAASLATGDAASLVQASRELGATLIKEGLHAAGVEDPELDKAVDLSASVGCGFAAPEATAGFEGATAGDVLKQQAMELGAGAGAGAAASSASGGEFSVLDSMTMTQGLGRGTLKAEGVQWSQVSLRSVELAGAAGLSAGAASAMGEDPAQAAKLGAQSGLQLMQLGRLELSSLAAEGELEDAKAALGEQEALAKQGLKAPKLEEARAQLTEAKSAAEAVAKERDALRGQLALQAGASLALALEGPDVGALASIEAGRSIGGAAVGGLNALSDLDAPKAEAPAEGSGYERLSAALADSGAVKIGSLAGVAGSVLLTVRRLRDQADAQRLAELAAFTPELQVVAEVEWERLQELRVIEAGVYRLSAETSRLSAGSASRRKERAEANTQAAGPARASAS